jgi:Holliday junction resolvasome RuvABC endonuclease subunit
MKLNQSMTLNRATDVIESVLRNADLTTVEVEAIHLLCQHAHGQFGLLRADLVEEFEGALRWLEPAEEDAADALAELALCHLTAKHSGPPSRPKT